MVSNGKICIMGAGHGGTSMAAHLGLMGREVNLWNRTPEHLEPIQQRGGIELLVPEGYDLPKGTASLSCVTSDMAEALDGARLVMVVVPATAHRDIARDGVYMPQQDNLPLAFAQHADGVARRVLVGAEAQGPHLRQQVGRHLSLFP